jgi:hypothetical protein
MTQPLDKNAVRKLDALNLVEAFAHDQPDNRQQILAIYAETSINDNGLACYELAYCCAILGSTRADHRAKTPSICRISPPGALNPCSAPTRENPWS